MLPCCHLKKSSSFGHVTNICWGNEKVVVQHSLLSDVDVCGPSLFVSELMCQSSASSPGDCSSILSRFISLPYLGNIYCGVTDCKLFYRRCVHCSQRKWENESHHWRSIHLYLLMKLSLFILRPHVPQEVSQYLQRRAHLYMFCHHYHSTVLSPARY